MVSCLLFVGCIKRHKYTLKIIRSESGISPGLNPAASWAGKTKMLEVVVKEEMTSNTVLHFLYK